MSIKSKSSDKKSKRVKRILKNGGTKHREANNQERTFIQGKERKVHEEIIYRRITGGDTFSKEANTEAYAHALKQWQELPGCIVRPSTDVIPSQKLPKSQETLTTSEQTNNDTGKGEESE